jgi:hypothetical protein
MKILIHKSKRFGYTLVEVLVASSILMMGIAAACYMSLNTITVEEINFRVARGMAVEECAARLWMLGLSPTQVDAVLPRNPDVELTWTASDPVMPSVGSLQGTTIDAKIYTVSAPVNAPNQTGLWTGGAAASLDPDDRAYRTQSVTVYRSAAQ